MVLFLRRLWPPCSVRIRVVSVWHSLRGMQVTPACPRDDAGGLGRRRSQDETGPHAMAGCAYDKGWIGSTCPRIHSRSLVHENGCCIGGGREGMCPLNCPGQVITDPVSGEVTSCECQTPCDPPQPLACTREPDFDECSSSPCQNGGDCQDGTDMYTCTCRGGWLGENCDIPPPVCANPHILQNHIRRF